MEVEKKFNLTPQQTERLLDGATRLGQSMNTMEDLYFDTEDYQLTLQNLWLRQRDGVYELKAPPITQSSSPIRTDRFREITALDEIRKELGVATDIDFDTALTQAGIYDFMICYTNRRSYEKEGFRIDIDSATYRSSLFKYAVAEIELMVDDESQADAAEERILDFALRHDLAVSQVVLGKIAAFLQVERPKHFRSLVAAHVI